MKPFALLLLLIATSALSAEPPKSDYAVVTRGRRVSSERIQKSDFGKVVSIYCLPGKPTAITLMGVVPEKLLTYDKEKKVNIWTGELHVILKRALRLRWYFDSERKNFREEAVLMDDIDYILIKE